MRRRTENEMFVAMRISAMRGVIGRIIAPRAVTINTTTTRSGLLVATLRSLDKALHICIKIPITPK
jgi:hypothetical protein